MNSITSASRVRAGSLASASPATASCEKSRSLVTPARSTSMIASQASRLKV
jgi:hypothetical protein